MLLCFFYNLIYFFIYFSRLKESHPTTLVTPVSKTIREQKVTVQKGADGGFGSDGYRWRKYGQKFVKGNPNPR